MKTFKRISCLLLALALILALSVTAFAEEGNTSTLTINTTAGHTYSVYQLLKGDVSGLEEGAGTLSNVSAGTNLKAGATTEDFLIHVHIFLQIHRLRLCPMRRQLLLYQAFPLF